MKSCSSPTLSRASSTTNVSKTTTVLDTPHAITDLHHSHSHHSHRSRRSYLTHHHTDSDATKEGTLKDSLYALSEKDSSDPVHILPLESGDFSDEDLKKGHHQDLEESGLEDVDLGWICTWDDLPQWMRDNPAIVTGYRRATYSYYKCIRSLWFLHNETVNIWSHLLGAVAFIIIAPIAYFKFLAVHEAIKWTDISVMYAFLVGAIICLSMSASFHTFSCHSEKERFQVPQFRWVRAGLFLSLGLSGLAPIIHATVLYGFPLAQKAAALNYMFCMGAAYVFGVLIYGSRTPECFFPGKFDNFGASHQIFHTCVLIGCAFHLVGVTKAMAFWHNTDPYCTVPLDQLKAMFD
ncbi:hypothetical protein BGZ80_002116 [Entomortierella chlamydospora]|uniref:Hemolysin-iii channel protein n=1 Tax=Entomortierella chlamydospora TaxID=101097 RepID=A0A9P6MQA2_9FUNG|nr:hypothetical protein BGZ80_002116 [Entomortierella chlamydospora]